MNDPTKVARGDRSLKCATGFFAFVYALFLIGCGMSAGGMSAVTAPAPTVAVTISGAPATRLGESTTFAATVINSSNQGVTWQVDGVPGGSATSGTISTAGVYVAPQVITATGAVTITAVSVAATPASASQTEVLWNPVPVIASGAATQLGTSDTYTLDLKGSGFAAGSTANIAGQTVAATFVSANEVTASYIASAGVTSVAVSLENPSPGPTQSDTVSVSLPHAAVSLASAARLLDQATFGPVLADMQHVQTVGLDGYLTEQFAVPAIPLVDTGVQPSKTEQYLFYRQWWSNAINGPDQLRERMAFALSQLYVVSMYGIDVQYLPTYQNLLANDAFGNFATLMHDVTLSPAMGSYLNLRDSAKPADGEIANENFAREMMQLFSIGLNELNADGTPILDSAGQPIPAYTEDQVQAFARAYTGWTFAPPPGGTLTSFPNLTANYDLPLTAMESAHDTGPKALLNGTVLLANQTAGQDLNGALANLFAHPNLPPFVCRQLIQHLVTGNPSAAYVKRVSDTFVNNGKGIRGDLQAVLRAILLDPEARAGDTAPDSDGGHLREPVLYISAVLRALSTQFLVDSGYFHLNDQAALLGEVPYGSSSVFNFFPPNYTVPGTQINAPEFALENTATVGGRLSLADTIVSDQLEFLHTDLSATSPLGTLAATPDILVDTLGTMFLHGQMAPDMRQVVLNAITPLTDMAARVRVATWLVITSTPYKLAQ